MSKNVFFVCLTILTGALATVAHAGKVELTTYYPAPMGEYQTVSTTESAYFATTSGSVGIGTTTPNYAGYGGRGLTINSLGRASYIELFRNENVGTDSMVGAWRAGTDVNSAIAGIDFLTGHDDKTKGAISFKVYKSGSLSDASNEAMRITDDGIVAINNTLTLAPVTGAASVQSGGTAGSLRYSSDAGGAGIGGVLYKDGSGWQKLSKPALGNWLNSFVKNTVYRASADGFVLASVYFDGGSYGLPADTPAFQAYTDSNSSPTTMVVGTGYGGRIDLFSMTFPVKKGDYWKVVFLGNSVTQPTIWWIPLE